MSPVSNLCFIKELSKMVLSWHDPGYRATMFVILSLTFLALTRPLTLDGETGPYRIFSDGTNVAVNKIPRDYSVINAQTLVTAGGVQLNRRIIGRYGRREIFLELYYGRRTSVMIPARRLLCVCPPNNIVIL